MRVVERTVWLFIDYHPPSNQEHEIIIIDAGVMRNCWTGIRPKNFAGGAAGHKTR